jgi:glycosyltransferase involved in cell wall biosynthesis
MTLGGRRIPVLLLRDVPEERRLSMERYADEVERGFAGNSRFDVRSTTVHSARGRGPIARPLSKYFTSFVPYPVHARRCNAWLYHIIDHGYAHLAAVLPRNRTIVTCHDLLLLRAEEGVAGFRGRRMSVIRFRWSVSYLRKVAHVVCVSQATARDVRRLCHVPPERITVVANGIDSRFQMLSEETVERVKTEMPKLGAHVVLHVCSPQGSAYKNVPMTLRVIAVLRHQGVDAALLRVGRLLTPEERRLAEDLRIADAILDCGTVSDERLVELYNASDALLYPSHYEGFGWPPLESMACGTPVIASTAPALVELVDGAGVLAPADDRDALAFALGEVLTSRDLATRLRRRGLDHAANYSWQRTVQALGTVYEKVIDAAWTGRE